MAELSPFPLEFSLILPAYNEGKVIARNLTQVDGHLKRMGISYEIIVVDDGSWDDTRVQISGLRLPKVKVLSYTPNRGKGYAVHQGMRLAQGRFHLFMDVDLSTDLKEVDIFLEVMRCGKTDVLVGNRNDRSVFAQQRPWHRALFGYCFACLSSLVLDCPLKDFTCGFKIFTADASRRAFSRQRIFGWAFDSEILMIARRQGLKIRELPVSWQHHDNSKVEVFKSMFKSFAELFNIRWHDLKGDYK